MFGVIVPAMPVVHEEVHQGTGRKKQIRQHTQDVRRMFGDEKERGDGEKACADSAHLCAPEALCG
jgi:hypothetical protein